MRKPLADPRWNSDTLWNANHPSSEIPPDIGSIGHILTGLIQADEPMRSSNVQVKKLSLKGSFTVGPAINVAAGISYNSFKEFGAIPTLAEPAESKDASNILYFKKIMCQNYRNWYNKARKEDHFDVDLDEIFLVTGCNYGSRWVNAVMKTTESEADVEISVGAAGFASGRFSAAIKETGSSSSLHRKNWVRISIPTENLDQALFVRGCKVVTRGWIDSLRKRFEKRIITDAMHLHEPLDLREFGLDILSYPSERDSGEEEEDGPDSPPSNGSGSSSPSFSWFSSSNVRYLATTRSANLEPMAEPIDSDDLGKTSSSGIQTPEMDADVLDVISDPLSLLLLYMLENSDAELAVAHHGHLSTLSLPVRLRVLSGMDLNF
ncbi:hypothetical protein M422DRAFT_242441 [Sphaerobolus stellatus SS14]|nr:hypothetical protein M422DRAFT_242441 [Sphaerobolus stellatus SS14]